MCDLTPSYARHVFRMYMTSEIDTDKSGSVVSPAYLWHDSCMTLCCRVLQCAAVCCSVLHSFAVSPAYLWRDFLTRVTWLLYMCDMTPLYIVQHGIDEIDTDNCRSVSWISLTWLLNMRDLIPSYVRHDFWCIYDTALHWRDRHRQLQECLLNICDMTLAWLCAAVCCSVLRCVAVCCSGLQCLLHICDMTLAWLCVAECCRVLQSVAVYCRVLQCVAVCCSALRCVAECCSVLQCLLHICDMTLAWLCVAVCCNTLQHSATHCFICATWLLLIWRSFGWMR